jgi:hypothetical protein
LVRSFATTDPEMVSAKDRLAGDRMMRNWHHDVEVRTTDDADVDF